MKIGKYDLYIVESGYLGLDGGAMFGIIPKPLWERTNPPDQANRVKLATRNLLLDSGPRKILIDTGMGNKWSKKLKEIYDIDQETSSLETSLNNLGYKFNDITDVILTHLHFDHTGGSTVYSDGKLLPAFPNAVYHIQQKNFDWAVNPTDRDKGSYISENFIPLKEAGVFNYINGDCKFDDEIELINMHGHTFFQQLIKLSDSSNTLLYSGDLFPFSSHLHLPFIMAYDLQPMITLEEKKKILEKAVKENWKLFFEHDPEVVMVTVEKTEKGFRANEKFYAV